MKVNVVVGIDQARASGWAIRIRELRDPAFWGLARNASERRDVVQRALDAARPKEILIVLEDHGKMPLSRRTKHDRRRLPRHGLAATLAAANQAGSSAPTRSTATILGMGDARGRWREQFELAGVPASHFVLVEPKVWRAAVFGRSAPRMGTDAAKALALRWATAEVGERVDDDNVAEALAIARWGALEGVLAFEATRGSRAGGGNPA